MRIRRVRFAIAVAVAAVLGLAPMQLIPTYADTGFPTSITATYDGTTGTLSVSGQFFWDGCMDDDEDEEKVVGFAIFIDGPDEDSIPGNPKRSDAEALDGSGMHLANNGYPCTIETGSWSDNTHNATTNPILSSKPSMVCAVIYDIELDEETGRHSQIGAGVDRNRDNSFEKKLGDKPRTTYSESSCTTPTAFFTTDVSDMIVFSDIPGKDLTKAITDTLAMTNHVGIIAQFVRNLDDNLVMTDTSIRELSRVLADTLTLSNGVHTIVSATRELSESLSMADISDKVSAVTRSLTDSLSLTDNADTMAAKSQSLTETMSMTDTVHTLAAITQALEEFLSIDDNADTIASINRVLTETISMLDNTNPIGAIIKVLTDNLSLNDNAMAASSKVQTVTETLNIADAPSLEINEHTVIDVSESLNVMDAVSAVPESPSDTMVTVSESLSVVDSVGAIPNVSQSNIVTISDSLTMLDTVDTALQSLSTTTVTLSESLSVLDTIDTAPESTSGVADTAGQNVEEKGKKGHGHGVFRGRDFAFDNPNTANYDDRSPTVGTVLTIQGGIKILAEIHDNVGVRDANIIIGTITLPMKQNEGNSLWWVGMIPSDLHSDKIFFNIVATDYAGNKAQLSTSASIESNEAETETRTNTHSFTPQSKKIDLKPNDFIKVSAADGAGTLGKHSDTIIIRNNSNSTLQSVRLMLSPEISDSFYLDRYSIKRIEPYGNATVSIRILGNPNEDAYGKVTAYNGSVMVMAPNHNPVILPVKIGSIENFHYNAYMEKVAEMEEKRIRIPLISTVLNNSIERSDIEITTRAGSREVNTSSGEIVIKNTSDRTLTNVRLVTSNLGHVFLLDKYNIPQIAPNGEVSIQMISKMDSKKYSPKDFVGEIIVVADNGLPEAIPVRIAGEERKDSMNEFEVATISNNNVTKAVDRITIKNIGNRTMDSVKIILTKELDIILHLSENSFRTIAPGEIAVSDLTFRSMGEKKEAFMHNYNGELTVVSEHHNLRKIPIQIEWKKVESEHFMVYTRSGDEQVGKQVIGVLENNYQKVNSRFGEMKTRTVIYIAGSMDEMKIVNPSGHSYYSYTDDAIFVCACDHAEYNALKEFMHRIITNNYASYHNMKKFMFDQENWLIDGISGYVVSNMTNKVPEYTDSFTNSTESFQWYGYGNDVQYGATHTFFKYLENKHGSKVIDKTIYYLGTGMISNHRCDTLENCAVLQAVYDASGLDMDNKKYTLDVKTLINEWKEHEHN